MEKENYEIQLLEEVKCKTKKELLEREGYRDICVNKSIAGRTYQQYRNDNAVKIREQREQYYKDNMVKIKEKNNQYYKNNVVNIKEVSKQYYKNNMVKIKEYSKDKLNCVCGGRFTRSNKAQHEKTNMHLSFKNI